MEPSSRCGWGRCDPWHSDPCGEFESLTVERVNAFPSWNWSPVRRCADIKPWATRLQTRSIAAESTITGESRPCPISPDPEHLVDSPPRLKYNRSVLFALAQRCWERLRGVDSRCVWDAGYGDVTKGASPRCSERDQLKEDKL